MATSEVLIESTVRHAVFLERLKAGEVKRFSAFLKRIDKSLRERLARRELTAFNRARLEKQLKDVDKLLVARYSEYSDDLTGELFELAEYEAGFEARNMNNAVTTAAFEATVPGVRQIRAAVLAAPLSVRGAGGGKLLKPFIDDWTRSERAQIIGAIRQGYYEGQTNHKIIQGIRGTRANKYRDGILATTSRHADAIVRTAVQHVASVARAETWKENEKYISGYRWVSTLDGRTTQQCKSLDGRIFKIGKGPKPPIHIRCRSTTVAELDGRYDYLKEGRTRASKGGYVDADETYYSWLKKQPAGFQNEAIGQERGKLLRKGGLSAEEFSRLNLDRNFKPLTLDEMRQREPAAFERAGI